MVIEWNTNIPNKYQDKLRFGALDFDIIQDNIVKDLLQTSRLCATFSLAVTCLDQVGINESISYYINGQLQANNVNNFLSDVKNYFTLFTNIYVSFGAERYSKGLLETNINNL